MSSSIFTSLQDNTFFRLTPNLTELLLQMRLTAAEWRIWAYLTNLDPFGDRGVKFIPAELMLKCGIKRSVYFKAKAKFQKFGFFSFQDGETKVFNLQKYLSNSQQADVIESANVDSQSANVDSQSANVDSQSANVDSQSANVDSQSANVDSQSANVDSQSANVDSQSANVDSRRLKALCSKDSKSLQTIQTEQTIQTSPLTPQGELRDGLIALPQTPPQKKGGDLEKGKSQGSNPRRLGTNPRALGTNPRSKAVEIDRTEETTVIEENKCSAAEIQNNAIVVRRQTDGLFGRQRVSRQELVNPYPEGEWMIDGKLDSNFVEWLAQEWLRSDATKFCNIHKAKADVRSYFANQPEKLPIRWQQYHEETLHRYNNTSDRIAAGIPINPEEQKMLVDRARAVATPIEELTTLYNCPQIEAKAILSLEATKTEEPAITTQAVSIAPSEPKKQPTVTDIPVDPKDGVAENSGAYKVFDRSSFEVKNQASAEDFKNFFANRIKKVQEAMSMPKANKVNPETELKQIQADLNDELLRKEASVQIRARKFAQSYKCDVVKSEDGLICYLELDF